MTTTAVTARAPGTRAGHSGFGRLLRAEWVKFRTVRGWVIGMLVALLVTAGVALLDHSACGGTVVARRQSDHGCRLPRPASGPGGEAVTDSFYFVHQPLAGNGSITVRMTSLASGQGPAGLQPWSKAGIIIKASTRPGSAYAAMMVTGRPRRADAVRLHRGHRRACLARCPRRRRDGCG